MKRKTTRQEKKEQKFNIYIYKVLKQVHPNTNISSKAMAIIDSFVKDILDQVTKESSMRPLFQFNTWLPPLSYVVRDQ